jgi:hypothetical protein
MLQKWEGKWQMAFNADKCFVIRAGTNRKTIKQDYTIHNHILEVDPSMWMYIPMWVLPL